MEKVQFQLESTLPELKDLEEKGLFSKAELKQITKRRTRFETALIKRVAKKEDFFEYAEYEIGLEKLRRLRWKRLNMDKNAPKRTISCYSIPRRVVYILRRATQKFSYDIASWLAYVDYARSEKMSKVVQSGLTSALQLHPQSAILYILLSHHYLHPNHAPPISTSPFAQPHNATTTSFSLEGVSSARTTLLLGLRMLPADQDLWREYIKLEIGWVEALRRRWRALGIEAASGGPSGLKNVVRGEEEMEEDIQRGLPEPMTEEDVLDLGQNAFGAAGEPARKAIIRGDLIVTVIRSSLEQAALGSSLAYHVSLIRLLRSYPTGLRLSLLEVVYQHLATMSNCAAQRICADRLLYDREYSTDEEVLRRTTEERGFDLEDEEDEVVLDGEELVGALGRIVTSMKKTPEVLKNQEGSWNEVVGIWLLKWAGRVGDNEALRTFLLAALAPRVKSDASPRLLHAYLQYLASLPATSPSALSLRSQLHLAEKYTTTNPADSALWRQRVNLAQQVLKPALIGNTYLEAMDAVGAGNGADAIWISGMEWFDRQVASSSNASVDIQPHWAQSFKAARNLVHGTRFPRKESESLYAALLMAWLRQTVQSVMGAPSSGGSVDRLLRQLLSTELDVPFDFFAPAFDLLAGSEAASPRQMETVRDAWIKKHRTYDERATAVLTWSNWAIQHGQAREAMDEVTKAKREIEGDTIVRTASRKEDERNKHSAIHRLETEWNAILQAMERGRHSVNSEDEEMSD